MIKNKISVETQTEDTVRTLPEPSQGYTAEILRDMLFEACSYKISPLAPNKGYTAEQGQLHRLIPQSEFTL